MGVDLSLASVPYLILAIGLVAIVVTMMLVRGDTVIRAALMAAGLLILPWTLAMAAMLSTRDPEFAASLGRLGLSFMVLVGPALLLLLLTLGGVLEKYRHTITISALFGLVCSMLTQTTDLVIQGAWQSPAGFWLPEAGPLNFLPRVTLFGSILLGVLLGGRSLTNRYFKRLSHPFIFLCCMILVAATDGVLLNYHLSAYPFGFIPGVIGTVVVFIGVYKYDLLRARGFERAAFYELVVMIGLIPLIMAIVLAALPNKQDGAWIAVVMLVPLFGTAQALVLMIYHHNASWRQQVNDEADSALDDFVDGSLQFRSEAELAESLISVLGEASTKLRDFRLLIADSKGFLQAVGEHTDSPVATSEAMRRWLTENQAPLVTSELVSRRLGPVRGQVETLLETLSSDVLVPLTDRESLIGVIVASQVSQRALPDSEHVLLAEAARTTAKALTFVRLFREAEERVQMAKELEIAAAVQHSRVPGGVNLRFKTCEVHAHYQPAAQFGGDWWMAHELPDNRVLVVIGDVTGRGMPAALVSSTVAGACVTAREMLGEKCDVLSLLQLLNDAVLAAGGSKYAMSCFAAVLDLANGTASFANAGHPFPYLCRRTSDDGERDELQALVARGTRLGIEDLKLSVSSISIQDDDIVVFYSDALVDAQNESGRRYSERRLQHVLKDFLRTAGDRACEVVIQDVLSHCGSQAIADDITLVIVRFHKPPS